MEGQVPEKSQWNEGYTIKPVCYVVGRSTGTGVFSDVVSIPRTLVMLMSDRDHETLALTVLIWRLGRLWNCSGWGAEDLRRAAVGVGILVF